VVLARLVPHKRIEHAFAVLAGLREEFPELRLDVVGSGWWHDELVSDAESWGVMDLVVWHGHLPDDERDRVLARAWIALLPSTNEGWGLSVVESAAQGTPTVAYREAGGVNESVLHGRTGVLIDSLDEMRDAVARLLRDPAELEAMSAAAQQNAARFSWENGAAELDRVLRAVAVGRTVSSSRS
jgi:glycosyltransferase involved in cell wall biosynthesis